MPIIGVKFVMKLKGNYRLVADWTNGPLIWKVDGAEWKAVDGEATAKDGMLAVVWDKSVTQPEWGAFTSPYTRICDDPWPVPPPPPPGTPPLPMTWPPPGTVGLAEAVLASKAKLLEAWLAK